MLTGPMLGAALVAAGAASPGAHDWRLAARGADVVHYIDAASVARMGGTVLFMEQMVYLVPLSLEGGLEVRRALVRREADCGTMSGRIVQITLYMTGNRFDSWVEHSPEEPALPGSAAEALYRAACARSFDGRTIADPAAHAVRLQP